MYKRTTGYLLLTLLVLTGLAGRIQSDTLDGRERKALLTDLRDSRSEFLNSLSGLSPAQLDFKDPQKKFTIRELIMFTSCMEECLWKEADKSRTVSEPLNEMLSEEAVKKLHASLSDNLIPIVTCSSTKNQRMDAALLRFQTSRSGLIRYVRTTTDPLRSYFISTSYGQLDAYQLLQLNAVYSRAAAQMTERIRKHPSFPRG